MDEQDRKPLSQMAKDTARAEAKSTGLTCPNCGCRDTRVIKTKHNWNGTETSRRRVCRNCGNRVTTMEIVL